MNKQWLTKSLKKTVGRELVNVSEVADYVGIDRSTARGWLVGIDYLRNGNEKLYSIDDVAEAMMARVNA